MAFKMRYIAQQICAAVSSNSQQPPSASAQSINNLSFILLSHFFCMLCPINCEFYHVNTLHYVHSLHYILLQNNLTSLLVSNTGRRNKTITELPLNPAEWQLFSFSSAETFEEMPLLPHWFFTPSDYSSHLM